MAATIKDIRDETGLSLATISNYLNGRHIREENRKKIEAAIEKLDYHPNEMARGLVTNRTKTIGFVVSNVRSAFDSMLVHYAGSLLHEHGYGILICDSDSDPVTEQRNIRYLTDKKADGILVIPVSDNAESLQPAMAANIPFVLLDRVIKGEFDSVSIDNCEAAENAVQDLICHGHRKIAVIASKEFTGSERYAGYLKAMSKAGLAVPPEYCRVVERFSVEAGYRQMEELLALPDPPTGVFLGNYEINIGAIMAINEHDLNCPKDISLTGFDDLILSGVVRPTLTLVQQPMESIIREGTRLLLGRMDGSIIGTPQKVVLFGRLRQGDSVRQIN